MPNKEETERQLLSALGKCEIKVKITFIYMETHNYKPKTLNYLNTRYKTFKEIRDKEVDAMIITGAPLEHINFHDVDYWDELKEIMDYSSSLQSTLYICWGAVAGLYHNHQIPKKLMDKKISGLYAHKLSTHSKLFTDFNQQLHIPQSRYFTIDPLDIKENMKLEILAYSENTGISTLVSKNGKEIYMTGHLEYEPHTLKNEYIRDKEKGLDPQIPSNYFIGNDPNNAIKFNWSEDCNRFFSNWIKYYVEKSHRRKLYDKKVSI